jgi:hypothetical protein
MRLTYPGEPQEYRAASQPTTLPGPGGSVHPRRPDNEPRERGCRAKTVSTVLPGPRRLL